MYNFDEIIDRRNTNAIKLERCKLLFGTEDVLPLWVADMDFRTPDFIINAIKERLEHPILGYSMAPKTLFPLMMEWVKSHHNWNLRREWINFLPGIVPGLSFAVQCFTQPGDEVIVQPPVYYPFFNVIEKNNRSVIHNPLKEENGKFVMNLEDLESKITPKTKLLLLCNPHNPGGRVWKKEELVKLAELCEKHQILIISDEIHADMVHAGHQHIPFATVSSWAENNSVTLMAPTKVFNMPSLISSAYIIPNANIRAQFAHFLEASELNNGNLFAYVGAEAAYKNGEQWRLEMLTYVQENINYVVHFLQTNIPQIVPMIPEASFLLWLDCKALGMDTDELHRFFAQKAGLGLNKGTTFGTGGEQHLRLNVACSRKILEQAMIQLANALHINI